MTHRLTRLVLALSLLLSLPLSLAACSLQGMAERSVPDAVRAEANRVVDEVMEGDLSALREAFPSESSAEFEAALARMAEEVRPGTERARNLVGFQSSASTELGSGSQRGYNLAYEVDTPNGFTVISQTYQGENGAPPRLVSLNVKGSDESTAAQIRRLGMAARLVGAALLMGLVLMGFILLRTRGRDEASPTPD